MSDTPEEPLPVSAGRRAGRRAARPREPGRPASRAEAASRAGAATPAGAGARAPARTRIGIRELRQHASIYVDLAEKGYTVDITNRGRLVAQLIPVREPGSPLQRLIAAGIIEPADEGGGVSGLDPYPAAPAGRPTASDILGQARRAQPGRARLPREAGG